MQLDLFLQIGLVYSTRTRIYGAASQPASGFGACMDKQLLDCLGRCLTSLSSHR